MSRARMLAFAGALAVATAAAGSAGATTLIVTSVGIDSGNTTFVPGHGNEITTR